MTYLSTWGEGWPDALTLVVAADLIAFDLFESDDESMMLLKSYVPIGKLGDLYEKSLTIENDGSGNRFTVLENGFNSGGHGVPPVVFFPEGLRDGNHRAILAKERGWSHVTAYLPYRDFRLF